MSQNESLTQLSELISRQGGELAAALARSADGEAFGPVVAAGERTRSDPGEYALLVESIFEGYLLHYWTGRLIDLADEDLRLLGGDFLYALGLSRLAALGDVEAVEELADLISLCARVHAAASGQDAVSPASGAWALCSLAVAGGAWDEGQEAKSRLRERPAEGADALQVALRRARELDIVQEAEQALIAFKAAVLRGRRST